MNYGCWTLMHPIEVCPPRNPHSMVCVSVPRLSISKPADVVAYNLSEWMESKGGGH